MHTEWKRFLEDAGAHVADDRVRHFQDPTVSRDPGEWPVVDARLAADADILSDLSHLGRLRVAGPDAERFLQNQLTSDVRAVTPERGQLSGYCTPKGRLLAVFRIDAEIDAEEDVFDLWLPREGIGPLLERLTMYRLRSRVDLTDESDAGVTFGYSGPRAGSRLGDRMDTLPETPYAVGRVGQTRVARLPGPHPRFAIWGPVEALTGLWSELATDAAPVGSDAWDLLDIRAGIPCIHPRSMEAFVPQMVNLDLVGGLSFTKGCFPGQEVVARLRYRGELKRRMYRARTDGACDPGTPLLHGDEARPAGKVVAAAPSPDGGVEFLAVLTIALADPDGLRLGGADGPSVTLLPLPYEIGADQAG